MASLSAAILIVVSAGLASWAYTANTTQHVVEAGLDEDGWPRNDPE